MLVCASDFGCVLVCVVCGCVGVCEGVCWCLSVRLLGCGSLVMWLRVCVGVYGCAWKCVWVCVGVCGFVGVWLCKWFCRARVAVWFCG